jgi:hypothetical protein
MSSFPCPVRFVPGLARSVTDWWTGIWSSWRAADVFEFLAHQRGDRTVVRLADRESGLSARTIVCRLSSVSGLYPYLVGNMAFANRFPNRKIWAGRE